MVRSKQRQVEDQTSKGLPSGFQEAYTFPGDAKGVPLSTAQTQRWQVKPAAPVVAGLEPRRSNRLPSKRKDDGVLSISDDVLNAPDDEQQKTTKKGKSKKPRRLYDDPSNTIYPAEEYPPVPDHLFPTDPKRRLDLLVCGLNPGLMSSKHAAHFRHPSNHFYRTLLSGGLTPYRWDPNACVEMLDQPEPWTSIGLTNICGRPTAEGGELGKGDYMRGTPVLERKVRQQAKPRVMVFTGKGIGEWWEKCCIESGGLTRRAKSKKASGAKRIKTEKLESPSKASIVKDEQDGCKSDVDASQTGRFVELAFPRSLPWSQEEKTGLGLLPSVIELELGEADEKVNPPHIKAEDGADDSKASNLSMSDYSRYCFLFVTTSPSGRVTTMHLPEKGQWMGRCRELVDWLKSIDSSSPTHSALCDDDMVVRTFEVVDHASLSSAPAENGR